MRRSLFLRFFAGYGAVILLMSAAVYLFAAHLIRTEYTRDKTRELEQLAALLADESLPLLGGSPGGALEEWARGAARRGGVRITVIDPGGHVLADSEKDPVDMENHLYRPEILPAVRGEVRSSVRYSSTLRSRMLYLSYPIRRGPDVAAVLRASFFMRDLDRIIGRLQGGLLRTIGGVTVLVLLLALGFTRSLTRPLGEFIAAARRVAAGDLDVKVSLRQRGELRRFAMSFNTMTERLGTAFQEVSDRKTELASILASIGEGLCAVDAEDRIVLANASFRRLAGGAEPEGRLSWEVLRSSTFGDLLRQAKEGQGATRGEVSIHGRTYLASVAYLPTQSWRVATFYDLTDERQVERVKKDFVLNVTRELRNPVSDITAFVESLAGRTPKESLASLQVVKRAADRLLAIVNDLLVLAELEEKGTRLDKEPVDVAPLAGRVLRTFDLASREKGLTLKLEAAADLPAVPANPGQLERLLMNLVDNALSYTDKGTVTVRLRQDGGRLVIEVADTGIGISEEHIPRIFERFYVVDTARSKTSGGTGLGLSIVKHIVLAHGGTIDVRSRVGAGTTFIVTLPIGG
jgi:two-component system, OmpR family, phosphate regulon sensor histidine kinase PhoR